MKKILKNFKSSPQSSIKWDNYFEIYENCLKKFIKKRITLVEIGIGNVGSLFMWRNFLGKKAKRSLRDDQIIKFSDIKK